MGWRNFKEAWDFINRVHEDNNRAVLETILIEKWKDYYTNIFFEETGEYKE